MSKKRRTFSAEFKQEAANLVLLQGYSINEASSTLGIGKTAMRSWVKQLSNELSGITPKGKAITFEHQKIKELEARCKRLEMEKDILKKATALLMSDNWRNTHSLTN